MKKAGKEMGPELYRTEAQSLARLPFRSPLSPETELRPLLPDDDRVSEFYSAELRKNLVVKKGQISTEEEYNAVRHEAFVGLFALNSLVPRVPNFVRVEAYDSASNSLYSEFVAGVSWAEFSLGCSFEDYQLVVLQVLLALFQANQLFGFVHGDLHSQNIIIQHLPKPVEIFWKGQLLLTSCFQPVIIDYDHSIVTINGQTFGPDIYERGDWHDDVDSLLQDALTDFDLEAQTRALALNQSLIRQVQAKGQRGLPAYFAQRSVAEVLAILRREQEQILKLMQLARLPDNIRKRALAQKAETLIYGSGTAEEPVVSFPWFLRDFLPELA